MKVWGHDSWLFNHHSFISSLYKYLLRASYWKFLVIKQWTVSPWRLTPKSLSDRFYFLPSPTVTILIPSFFAASILFSHRHIWETVCGDPSKLQSCGSFLRAFDISYYAQNIWPFHALDSILLSLASILVFTAGNAFALTVPCVFCPWHRQPSCLVNTIDSSKSCFYITSFAKTSLKYTITPYLLVQNSITIMLFCHCCDLFAHFCLYCRASLRLRTWLINHYSP